MIEGASNLNFHSCIALTLLLFSQTSRVKFSQMRRDVLEKLELVDAKFQSDFPQIAKSILRRRSQHQRDTAAALALTSVFPIEVKGVEHKTEKYKLN